MKNLLATSLLSVLLNGGDESKKLLEILQSKLESNQRFYATSFSLLEILQTKKWMSFEDRREFLQQSGILCEEIYPVTKEDIRLYSDLIAGRTLEKGLELIELAVSINRGMDALLVYGSSLESERGVRIIDLKSSA